MATDERLFSLFRALEQEITPDAAFAERLHGLLKAEVGFLPTGRPTWRRWLPRFGAAVPRPLVLTPRIVVLVVLALLLATGIAAAAYLVIQGWLSTGPRGIQFSDEFTFAEVYRDGGAPWEPGPLPTSVAYADFTISNDGSVIYAVRLPSHPDLSAALVRFSGLDSSTMIREEFLDYDGLADPALWDAGIDTSAVDIGIVPSGGSNDLLSVAPSGQLFLAAGAYGRERVPLPQAEMLEAELRANWPGISDEEVERATTRQPLLGVSVIALGADGLLQRVLSIGELRVSGLVPSDEADASISAVASAADRLWVKTDVFHLDGTSTFLFEVVDPNQDRDWADRVILPLLLPEQLPWQPGRAGDPGSGVWFDQGLVVETTTDRVDRTRSVLLPILSTSAEYRIYRLTDANDDGDLRGEGETRLIFTGQPGFGDARGPVLASRVVIDGSEEILRELLVSGVTGPSRIARVDENGGVKDIARALDFGPEDIEAAPNGDIFVVVQESGMPDGPAPSYVVYRLSPLPAGATPPPIQSATPPSATADGSLTPDVARIGYTLEVWTEPATSRIMVVGADGSGPTEFVPGEHNSYFCQSADGSLVAFWSDEEVPHEPFVYVANADGTGRQKLSEDVDWFVCGFSSDAILIKTRATRALVRHDLETGEETELLKDADPDRIQADPVGRRYLLVSGDRGVAETLELIDADTGERLVVSGPLPLGRSFGALTWSADGELIAFAVGPPPSDAELEPFGLIEVYVQEVAGLPPLLVHSFEGRPPRLGVSADSSSLLISSPPPVGSSVEAGPLVLVDLGTRGVQVVADQAIWAGWHPHDAARFAYATVDRIFLTSVDDAAVELARAPAEGVCPDCGPDGPPPGKWVLGNWMGWSPDGRYIGLADYSSVVGVIDAESGELRIVARDPQDGFVSAPRWLD